MADGVDHIDIYADVEEEFSQVKPFIFFHHSKLTPGALFYISLFSIREEQMSFRLVQMAPIAHGLCVH